MSEHNAIKNSGNQLYKPWSVLINGHPAVDNNKLDFGLKKMYLGLHKEEKRSVTLSVMSIINSSKNSRGNSINKIEQEPENMATPQVITQRSSRASPVGNLLPVPSMVSISPCADVETFENDSFWNSLWGDVKNENPESPKDQNIFRPKSDVAKALSFLKENSFLIVTPATATSTSIPTGLECLSVPASQEELALGNFTGKGKNLPRALKVLNKKINDTSVRNVIKYIGTTLMPDKVSGMKGFRSAMTNLMGGSIKPTVESKCNSKPGFLSVSLGAWTADKSRTSGSNVIGDLSRKVDRR
jgi:hypothetical protein